MNAIFVNGFMAALIAGMVTGVGGLLVFLKKRYYKAEKRILYAKARILFEHY